MSKENENRMNLSILLFYLTNLSLKIKVMV